MPAFGTNDFELYDASDLTKRLRWDVSAILPNTIVYLTVPYFGGGTMAIVEYGNAWTARQTLGAGMSSIFTDANIGLVLHRLEAATTGPACRWEDHVGAGWAVLNHQGRFPVNGTSGLAFCDATDITKIVGLDLTGITPGTSRTLRAPNLATIMLGGAGNDSDPPSSGSIGKVDRTAQPAAIASTKLTDTTPAGYYRVHYTLEVTTADVTAGTIQFGIAYTDDLGATTQAGAALILTATGRDRGSFEVYLASGNITYTGAVVGAVNAARYALRVRCEFLG